MAKPAKYDFPPVLIVSGTQAFLRERLVAQLAETLAARGYRRDRVPGGDLHGLESATGGSSLMVDPIFVEVVDPEDVLVAAIERHDAGGDDAARDAIVVLHFRGTAPKAGKVGKLVTALASRHRFFTDPPPWEAEKQAVPFLIEEVKTRGCTIDEGFAKALVRAVGTELGILSFEALKAVTLARSYGKTVLDGDVLRGSMAVLAEAELAPLQAALVARRPIDVSKALAKIRATARHESTIRVCRNLGGFATRAAAIADMAQRGLSTDEIASRLGGRGEWQVRNVLLPEARSLGLAGALELAQIMSQGERAVLDGHMAPWIGLSSRLIQWCGGYGKGQMP